MAGVEGESLLCCTGPSNTRFDRSEESRESEGHVLCEWSGGRRALAKGKDTENH
jgi:hypothetical protein